jgi:hypothetical protein
MTKTVNFNTIVENTTWCPLPKKKYFDSILFLRFMLKRGISMIIMYYARFNNKVFTFFNAVNMYVHCDRYIKQLAFH